MKRASARFYFPFLFFTFNSLFLAGQEKKDDFIDLNTIKLSIGQLPVNAVSITFEKQIAEKSSLEFSPSFIFKNGFWYEFSDEFILSKGLGLDASIRRYFDKKRYIFQPFFRSYLSLGLSWKHTSYDSTWFIFQGGDPTEDECTLAIKKFDYIGMRVLFGLQKRSGRLVLDMNLGLGFRAMIRNYNYLARNLNGTGCAIVPTTEFVFPDQTGTLTDFSPTIHAGIKLGIRWGRQKASSDRGSNPEGPGLK